MIGYQIGPVTYRNFGPFEEASFDFSLPGLTLVEGRIEGRRGCDSNGAGKSFLFDGVAWALYGRCIREKYKGDDVVRLDSKGGACVAVEIVGGEHPIVVERYRKHPKHKNRVRLLIDGEDVSRGTDDATTEAIETLVGMDFLAFCNSVAFGVREDVKSFFSAPEAERKKVMDRIFGLLVYADAEKVARSKLKQVETAIKVLDLKRTSLSTQVSERTEQLNGAKAAQGADDATLQIKELKIKVAGLDKKIAKVGKHAEDLNLELSHEEEKFEAVMAAYKESEKAYRKEKLRLDQEERKLQKGIAEWSGKAKAAQRTQAKFNELKGTQCPTCFQKVSDEAVKTVKAGTQGEIDEAQGAISVLQKKLATVQTALEELPEPEEPVSAEMEKLTEELEQVDDALQEQKHERDVHKARLETLQGEKQRQKGAVEAAKAKLDEAVQALAQTEEEYAAKCTVKDRFAFWVQGYGNAGLKSFLLEAEIPEINRRATAYARRLLGEGTLVKLSATKTLKSSAVREQLDIEASIPGCTKTYAGASKGQKKRLDLALLLAFRDIVSGRNAKPFQQLFADEIFDGLDKTGNESVASLLLEVSESCPVTLVTHISGLKSIAHHTVIVYHTNEKATLLANGALPEYQAPVKKKAKAAPKAKLKPKRPSLKKRIKRK